ncbi:Uncharacterised protein, partial [Mesomycoplasma hyorhinis]
MYFKIATLNEALIDKAKIFIKKNEEKMDVFLYFFTRKLLYISSSDNLLFIIGIFYCFSSYIRLIVNVATKFKKEIQLSNTSKNSPIGFRIEVVIIKIFFSADFAIKFSKVLFKVW